MSAKIISATEASHTFSELLNRVYYQGQTFEIKRGKEIVARIVPMSASSDAKKVKSSLDLKDFFNNLPALDIEDQENFKNEIENIRLLDKSKVESWD